MPNDLLHCQLATEENKYLNAVDGNVHKVYTQWHFQSLKIIDYLTKNIILMFF